MGLLDILNGMQNGPRGQSTPAPAGSGGMSPITMALMGLLAYKAIKHLSPGQTNTGTRVRMLQSLPAHPEADLVACFQAGLAVCCKAHWVACSLAVRPEAS